MVYITMTVKLVEKHFIFYCPVLDKFVGLENNESMVFADRIEDTPRTFFELTSVINYCIEYPHMLWYKLIPYIYSIKKEVATPLFTDKMINYYEETCHLEVVKNNWKGITYIQTPSEEVQLEAVKQNSESMKYIINPTKKVKNYYFQLQSLQT